MAPDFRPLMTVAIFQVVTDQIVVVLLVLMSMQMWIVMAMVYWTMLVALLSTAGVG